MTYLRLPGHYAMSIALLLTFGIAGNPALLAKDPPADACAMLPGTQLDKVLGQPFGPPAKTTAPAAPQDRITGTDCNFQAAKGTSRKLLFRIYLDPSTAVAKDTFTQLSAYYGPNTQVAGNWDIAYLDAHHAIHVQKGKARYYLNLDPVGGDPAQTDKQLKDLARWVAGQL